MENKYTNENSFINDEGFSHNQKLVTRSWQGMLLLALSFSTAFAQNVAPDPGHGGTVAGFEVDADFVSGTIPNFWNAGNYYNYGISTRYGDDWSKGATFNAVLNQVGGVSVPGLSSNGRALWKVDGNWGNQSSVPEVVSFAGNSNKNGDAINVGQKPYSLQLGGTGPQKNDITQSFLHTRNDANTGDLWLFFGAETRATDGNSYIDFEYNQNGVTITSNQLRGPANNSSLNIINGRTVNDFILVVNYTGGGNRPIVGVRKWLASGQWSAELPLTDNNSFMTTNTAAIAAVAPNKGFAGNGAYSNVTDALQFVEGGVNITALNLALNLCSPVATVSVKTRSSSSFTAELKDLDVMNFSLTPPATLTALASLAACPNDTVQFSTTVGGSGASASNVQWYFGTTLISNSAKYIISTSGSTSSLTVNGVVPADTGIYKARLVNADCGTPEQTARLSFSTPPSAPVLTIVNPTCSTATGTITITSPVGSSYSYRNNGGAWQASTEFTFSGGDGYYIEVRSAANPNCISSATSCDAENQQSSRLADPEVKVEERVELVAKDHLLIYPNPNTGISTLKFTVEKPGLATINLYDIKGQFVKQIYSKPIDSGVEYSINVDGSELINGMYFSRLIVDDSVIKSQKFIIQR
jgi:hypothetical protein